MDVLGVNVSSCWIAVLLLCVTAYLYCTWNFGVLRKMGVPHPRPIPGLGNMLYDVKEGPRNSDDVFTKMFGKIYGFYYGWAPFVCIGEPELIKQILVKDYDSFQDRLPIPLREPTLQVSLFDMAGDEHYRHTRRYISPAFSSGKMRQIAPLITKCADRFLVNLQRHYESKTEVDCKVVCSNYTMEVVASTGFGLDLGTSSETSEFVKNAHKMFDFSAVNIPFLISLCFPILGPVFQYFGFTMFSDKDALSFFRRVVSDALHERRTSREARHDFLGNMVEAERDFKDQSEGDESSKGGLSNDEIAAHTLLFLIAGYHTTAATLMFVMYSLAIHPECQEKVIHEIKHHIPAGTEPDYDNVLKLTYLGQCLDETMRMYAAAPRMGRITGRDTQLGGIKIPKGMRVFIPVMAVHMNPEFWPDPEKFDPDRFTKEAKDERHPYSFIPFGHGPRHCIGMRLAELEMRILMARVLRKFRFTITPRTQVPPVLKKHGFLPETEGPMLVGVEPVN